MRIGRLALTFAFTFVIASLPLTAMADPGDPPGASEHFHQSNHDGETYVGRVESVDYQNGELRLATRRHGLISINVVPNTNVVEPRSSEYRSITDIHRGSPISVETRSVDGGIRAEVIELHDH